VIASLKNRKLWAALLLLALIIAAGWWWSTRDAGNAPTFRFGKIERGPITATISSTGTLNPVTSVQVGTQVSGQIKELFVDFNSPVKKGQLIARIDPETFEYRVRQAEADLEAARSAVGRAQVSLIVAERDLKRTRELVARNFVSSAELDRAQSTFDLAAAEVQTARAVVQQRTAQLQTSRVDLSRTEIRAPVDGVVIKRSVDVGQTVAASLQAPTLFLIADDLRRMEIAANVDEADVGNVRDGQRATFTVNAFPSRTFEGRVKQVRLGSQTVQNVVIYTAIISVENPRLELRPGMTANLRIETERRDDVLRVPNAALRWRPPTQQPDATVTSPLPLDPAPRGPSDTASGGRRAMQEYVAAIRGELGLAAEQQRALDALLAEQRRGFGGLAAEPDPVARRAKFVEMRRGLESSIAELLTPEQQTKFRAIVDRFTPGSGTREGQAGRVYVVGSDGKPQQIALRLGATDGSVTEVMAGQLEATREVIVGGGQREAPRTPPRFGF
jgi:HlyD family secretion protein